MNNTLLTYLAVALPGWLLATVVALGLVAWTPVPRPLVWLLLAVWVGKDLVAYPLMRRFYEPKPCARGIVGGRGTAETALQPDGFVRVHGELWQARCSEESLPPGTPVRVTAMRGMILVVHADGQAVAPRGQAVATPRASEGTGRCGDGPSSRRRR